MYSRLDCLQIAMKNSKSTVVFFAVGFETTAPTNAAPVKQDRRQGLQRIRSDELVDEHASQLDEGFAIDAIFESAQGRRRGERGRLVRTGVIGGGLPQRILAQVLVIVEIFVTAGAAEDALGEEGALRVNDEEVLPRIGNGVVQGVEQADLPVSLAEQEQPRIGGNRAPENFAASFRRRALLNPNRNVRS